MGEMKKQLVELLNIYGVSGQETAVRSYLTPILKGLVDNVWIDAYGNLLGVKKCGNGKGATVMLSAHMDTVSGVREEKIVVEKDGIITAVLPNGERGVLGADDRAGITIILTALKNIPESFNGTIKVAFSREEEIGCRGADKIGVHFYSDVDLAIVVDRRGSRDIVVGCSGAFCSDTVGNFMEDVSEMAGMDYKCVEGGISDAYVFSANGINSINLSAGYNNEHTTVEYVIVEDMRDTVKLILQTLAVIDSFAPMFDEVPRYNEWVIPYNNYDRSTINQDNSLYLEGEESLSEIVAFNDDGQIIIEQDGNQVIMTIEQLFLINEKFSADKIINNK